MISNAVMTTVSPAVASAGDFAGSAVAGVGNGINGVGRSLENTIRGYGDSTKDYGNAIKDWTKASGTRDGTAANPLGLSGPGGSKAFAIPKAQKKIEPSKPKPQLKITDGKTAGKVPSGAPKASSVAKPQTKVPTGSAKPPADTRTVVPSPKTNATAKPASKPASKPNNAKPVVKSSVTPQKAAVPQKGVIPNSQQKKQVKSATSASNPLGL